VIGPSPSGGRVEPWAPPAADGGRALPRFAPPARPAFRAGRAFFLALALAIFPVGIPAAAGPAIEISVAIPGNEPPPLPETARLGRSMPRVAIIIDDMGYDEQAAADLLALDIPLTFSILPDGPHRAEVARRAIDAGVELMLHLPMEPLEYPAVSPGPGALLNIHSAEDIADRVRTALDLVPAAKGVNNHMGSRLTGMAAPVHRVLVLLRERDLYFVDSVTSPSSLCAAVARRLRVPFADRDVFLDHDPRPAAIGRQIDRLIRTARQTDRAVGIGHPHAATLEALRDALPRLRESVRIVPASRIVRTPG
jgi:uncharacterized protein